MLYLEMLEDLIESYILKLNDFVHSGAVYNNIMCGDV